MIQILLSKLGYFSKYNFSRIPTHFSRFRYVTTTVNTRKSEPYLSHQAFNSLLTSESVSLKSVALHSVWVEDSTFLHILKIYKSIHRNLEISTLYTVPAEDVWPVEYHGYLLGKKVAKIRTKAKYVSDEYKSKLDELGFVWNVKEYRFQKADWAFKIYKTIYGHLQVSQAFVVPSDSEEWPSELWGYRLGKIVNNIRFGRMLTERRKYFEEMGLDYNTSYFSYSFASIKKSIQVYMTRHRTIRMPYNYVIATNDQEYPEDMRGVCLGQIVRNIVHKNYYSDYHDELEKIGFTLLPRQFNRYFEAMQCYKKIYGHLTDVPHNYIIPKDSKEFPAHLWGVRLGEKLLNIRDGKCFKQYHDQLRELGVPLPNDNSKKIGVMKNEPKLPDSITPHDELIKTSRKVSHQSSKRVTWFGDDTFLHILKIYKSIHRNLEISTLYTVPAEDVWPVEYHGYPLGKKVAKIRTKAKYVSDEYISKLDELGFVWNVKEYRFQKADWAFKMYKTIYGHLQVPTTFVVPSDSEEWPSELWGYRLGLVVQNIRYHDLYSEKRMYFEKMGFVYEKSPHRVIDFDVIKECLEVFQRKHGLFHLPRNFVIPTNDVEYPETMRGANLGKILHDTIQYNQWSKRHEELEKMGIPIFPSSSLKFNYYFQALQYYKKIYSQLIDVPHNYIIPEGSKEFPTHLWGLKLGKVLFDIQHKGIFKRYHSHLRALGVPVPTTMRE